MHYHYIFQWGKYKVYYYDYKYSNINYMAVIKYRVQYTLNC